MDGAIGCCSDAEALVYGPLFGEFAWSREVLSGLGGEVPRVLAVQHMTYGRVNVVKG